MYSMPIVLLGRSSSWGAGGLTWSDDFTGTDGDVEDDISYSVSFTQGAANASWDRINGATSGEFQMTTPTANRGKGLHSLAGSDTGDVYCELTFDSFTSVGSVCQGGPMMYETGTGDWVSAYWREDQTRWRIDRNGTEVASVSGAGNRPAAGELMRLERLDIGGGTIRYRGLLAGTQIITYDDTDANRLDGAVHYGMYAYFGNSGNDFAFRDGAGAPI